MEWGRGYSLINDDNNNQGAPNNSQNSSKGSKAGEVNEVLFQNLLEMGYEERLAKASLVKTSSRSIDLAIDWILANSESFYDGDDNDDDVDMDEKESKESSNNNKEEKGEGEEEKEEEQPKERRVITDEERAEQEKRLQARLRDMREQQRLKEIKEEREREIKRVESAAQMTQTKRELEELKRKKDLEEIKRQRIADKKYRQEVLRKVEEAKQDRARKFNYSSQPSYPLPVTHNNNNNDNNNSSSHSHNNNNRAEYTTCEVAIRYQGQEMKHTFNADDTMMEVHTFVRGFLQGNPRPFSLIAGYPKVTYSTKSNNLNISLRDAQLCPRALIQLHF